jgi:hypothetical protein
MMVKLINPGAVLRDPVTKHRLPAKGGDVPETSFWVRRKLDCEIRPMTAEEIAAFRKSESESEPQADPPSGVEPVAPLTTR